MTRDNKQVDCFVYPLAVRATESALMQWKGESAYSTPQFGRDMEFQSQQQLIEYIYKNGKRL